VLNLEGMRREYASGIPNPEVIAPEGDTLDAALLARPGNVDIQLDAFLAYAYNVKALPELPGIFQNMEATPICDLGQARSLFHSRRRKGLSARQPECNSTVSGYRALLPLKPMSRRLRSPCESFSQGVQAP